MTGSLEAGSRRALAETRKQFTGQKQREDTAAEVEPWYHPFDWCDLILLVVPIAIVVFGLWWEAT